MRASAWYHNSSHAVDDTLPVQFRLLSVRTYWNEHSTGVHPESESTRVTEHLNPAEQLLLNENITDV